MASSVRSLRAAAPRAASLLSTASRPASAGKFALAASQAARRGYAIDTRGPPQPPMKEQMNLETGKEAPTFLGTTKRLPEFNMADKVVLVSGGARGLGLTQAEALLEAGATGKLTQIYRRQHTSKS